MTNEFMDATGPISYWSYVIQKVFFSYITVYDKNNVKFLTAVVGFKCPTKVDSESLAARFWPFPRFAAPGDPHRLITCVEGHPRLIGCGEEKIFDPSTLTCEEP